MGTQIQGFPKERITPPVDNRGGSAEKGVYGMGGLAKNSYSGTRGGVYKKQ